MERPSLAYQAQCERIAELSTEAKRLTLSYYGECLCTHYSLNSITLIELSQFVKTQLLLAYNRLKLSVE